MDTLGAVTGSVRAVRWSGVELRALRLAMRMSVVEAARVVGVPVTSWRLWERDGADAVVPSVVQRRLDDYLLARADAEVRERVFSAVDGVKHPVPMSAPLHLSPHLSPGSVFVWTGHEVRLLREARRTSAREFAAHLGVSDRMVSKWEAAGRGIRPRPVNQQALDTSLRQADPDARERFYAALAPQLPMGEQAAVSSSGGRRPMSESPPNRPPDCGSASSRSERMLSGSGQPSHCPMRTDIPARGTGRLPQGIRRPAGRLSCLFGRSAKSLWRSRQSALLPQWGGFLGCRWAGFGYGSLPVRLGWSGARHKGAWFCLPALGLGVAESGGAPLSGRA